MITTTGITTPVITLSFAVKFDELISAAELTVGLEEMLIGVGDGDVVEVSGVAVVTGGVAFTTCTSDGLIVICPITSSGASPFSQSENTRNELNMDARLDAKAVALALADLVIDGPSEEMFAEL